MSQTPTNHAGGDADVAAAALRGEASAHERIYTAHAGRVTAYFLRCGFVGSDVDDLRQDVFLRVFSSLATYDPARGRLRTWIGAIARNVARKRWSQRPRWDMFDPELAEAVFADDPAPAESPAAREEFQAVRECVASLPPELANLVHLRYEQGRTLRNIANSTGTPEATVRSRLAEARSRIAACLRTKGVLE